MDISNKCLSVFKSFINDISNVFPEYKETIEGVYGSLLQLDECNIEDQEVLKEFLDRVHKLNKKITNKDESIFTEDNLLLTDISFKHIWETNISYKTKETIWKYLQTFCLLVLNHESNKDLQDALLHLSENKQMEIKDKKIASDVKKIKKMTENIKEPIAEDISNESDPFEAMMNSTNIGKIAQEVSESLNFDELLQGNSDNPMELFQNLMSGDMIGKIMGSIHDVVNDKVDKGELNKDSMSNEAKELYNKMGNNPLFKAMNQMQESKVASDQSKVASDQSKVASDQSKVVSQQSKSYQGNKTKDRLQRKLKAKQSVQVNKVDESG
jgi:hypothetical protein